MHIVNFVTIMADFAGECATMDGGLFGWDLTMRTPAGKECRFYYADYNRGRDLQKCRLIEGNPASLPWRPKYCFSCPVPEILNANASPDMELTLTVKPR